MKHSYSITFLLLGFFFLSQVIGLGIIATDAYVAQSDAGEVVLTYPDTAIGERPTLEPSQSVLTIVFAIAVGTIILFILMRFKQFAVWKFWFFLSIFLTLYISFTVLVGTFIAFFIALALALWRWLRPNPYVHNLTELFVYAGIALIFVPILNVMWVTVLMVIIAGYDAYAVWKSKHMIKLAEFQAGNKTFAGLYFGSRKVERAATPKEYKKSGKSKRKKTVHAILGGGDIAFPLIFSGVVMQSLLLEGVSKVSAFLQTLLIPVCCVGALSYLFFRGTSARYYPAIPYLLVGCLVGYVLVLL